jgi:CheY-like chemotaxis protein
VKPSILIFVVEDDLIVQELMQVILEDGGYQVTVASDGTKAMAILEEHLPKFSALVTDIDLMHDAITGWDIAKRAREMNPDLPVIYTTGASGNEWASRGEPNSVLLTKPFAPAQLATAISQLLNAIGPTPYQ